MSRIDPLGLDYTLIRVFPLDTFIVFHTPVGTGKFEFPVFKGIYNIENSGCIGICIIPDGEFDRGKDRGPQGPAVYKPPPTCP